MFVNGLEVACHRFDCTRGVSVSQRGGWAGDMGEWVKEPLTAVRGWWGGELGLVVKELGEPEEPER